MDFDVYIYNGEISRLGYWILTQTINERKNSKGLNKKVVVCVSTYGGDPNAGFRIGRALQHNYEDVAVFVVGPCKSAGTLLAISANTLIIGDTGELGPLDIQLRKPDEIGELSSGLDTIEATNNITSMAISCFSDCLHYIRDNDRLSTKLSADMAVKLVQAVISPISSQIDPIRLSEHNRAMTIALAYGGRLDEKFKNLRQDKLIYLASRYPSHGFVIDRKEARTLFKRVEAPDEKLLEFYNVYANLVHDGKLNISGNAMVFDWTDEILMAEETTDENDTRKHDNPNGKETVRTSNKRKEQREPSDNTKQVERAERDAQKSNSSK